MTLRSVLSTCSLLLLASCGATGSLHVLPTLPPPSATPEDVALVVTANERGSLSVFDHPARTTLRSIDVAGSPAAVVSAGDGRTVLVAVNDADGRDLLVRIDVRTGDELGRLELGAKLQLVAGALTPDRTRVLLLAQGSSELLTVDVATMKVAGRRSLAGETLRAVAALDDRRAVVAASNSVLVLTLASDERKTVGLAGPAMGLVVGKGRIYATVSKPTQLATIDARTLAVTTVDLPSSDGPVGVALTPDGSAALVADGGRQSTGPGSRVLRVGLAKGEASVFSAVLGQAPRAIAVDGTGLVWAANRLSSTITILAPGGDFVLELPTGRSPVSVALVSAVAREEPRTR